MRLERALNVDLLSTTTSSSVDNYKLHSQPIVGAICLLHEDKTFTVDSAGERQEPVSDQARFTREVRKHNHFLKASDIVRMIVLLSKADKLRIQTPAWRLVALISFCHAAFPIVQSVLRRETHEVHPIDRTTELNVGYFCLIGGAALGFFSIVFWKKLSARVSVIVGWAAVSLGIVFFFWWVGLTLHSVSFLVNFLLTFHITIRLSKCYEDYYERYQRVLYLLHLTPWPTMKPSHRVKSFGLLPTFDLASTANMIAWNKMRIFLQTYEIKASRKRQLSVVWVLVAWFACAIFQTIKFIDPTKGSSDTASFFVFSNTFQLALGLSLIMRQGTLTNDLQGIGFDYMLRVKQSQLISKGSHFLVEHQRWFHSKTMSLSEQEFLEEIDVYQDTSKYLRSNTFQPQSDDGLGTLCKRAAAVKVPTEKIKEALDTPEDLNQPNRKTNQTRIDKIRTLIEEQEEQHEQKETNYANYLGDLSLGQLTEIAIADGVDENSLEQALNKPNPEKALGKTLLV